MILFILLALLIAAIRGKRVTGLLRERSLYPLWVLEIVFWIFQISAWMGDYRFIPYGALLQTACMLSLLWPCLLYTSCDDPRPGRADGLQNAVRQSCAGSLHP